MSEIFVVKRNGSKELFNIEKINRVAEWAVQGLDDVSLSELEINVRLNLKDGITTKEIHSVLTESAANLISLEKPNYQYVAGRLLNFSLRKDVWYGKNPPKLYDLIKKNIARKVYDPEILNWYSPEEINKIDEFIEHDRDLLFSYAGVRQLCDKYLVQNRETHQIFETPQFAYILIAACLFHKYPGQKRFDYIKRAYNYFSKHKINLPTPIMAGVRTTLRSFSSCCLIDVGDSMDSIFASISAVGHASSNRYGLGVNMGRIRPINSAIRNGDVVHTGVIPFTKVIESVVQSCHQNGLRNSSATINFPIWHYEIEDIIQLKNNGGTDSNRVRGLDYAISISKLFYERFQKNENITLFSPHEAKGLYDAFGLPEFDKLYLEYESCDNLKFKKSVSARSLFSLLTKERVETGRIYIMNIDHANHHSPWKEKVSMANLCCEITVPTISLTSYQDPDAEIGICILAALNWPQINSDSEMEKVCDVIVRMLDELIDYQNYFNQAARNFATKKRSLGIGITNLAYFLAKNGLSYESPESLTLVDEWMEKQQYYLLSASNKLAQEKGIHDHFDKSKYSDGVLPIDTHKKDVDNICKRKLSMNWDELREKIKKHGLRHATLTAQMPCESTSVISNSTNGIEPPRHLISYKKSKARTLTFLVPEAKKLKDKYTLAFGMKSNVGYLNICAVIQKYMDMAISANVYYNFPLDDSLVLKEMLYHYKMGGKTIYYTNTDDGNNQVLESKGNGCAGACTI